jgi:hypothetical protein
VHLERVTALFLDDVRVVVGLSRVIDAAAVAVGDAAFAHVTLRPGARSTAPGRGIQRKTSSGSGTRALLTAAPGRSPEAADGRLRGAIREIPAVGRVRWGAGRRLGRGARAGHPPTRGRSSPTITQCGDHGRRARSCEWGVPRAMTLPDTGAVGSVPAFSTDDARQLGRPLLAAGVACVLQAALGAGT